MSHAKIKLYEKISAELIESGEAQSGTMMGFPSLRYRSRYFACKDKSTGALIVKLTEKKVSSLIQAGKAKPFSPAGQLFKTWAVIQDFDEELWRSVLQEARQYALESLVKTTDTSNQA